MAEGNGNGKNKLLTIGTMAQACGTTTRAIRFYESQGLISSSRRSRGGGRLFERSELNRLSLVRSLRRSGFPIKTIARLLAIPEESATAARAARSVNETLRNQVVEMTKLMKAMKSLSDDLAQTAEMLTGCYGCEMPFDKLDCGECDCCRDVPKDSFPMALRAVWPMKGA
jgi:DNA-binding transcriptional MerR regulator